MNWILNLWVVVVGLAAGSFLNVVIHRVPRGESLMGYSRCPHCSHRVGWRHLVPVLSYLALGGRCVQCRGAIAWRYPLIEALTAGAAVAVVWRFGWTPWAAVCFVFVAALIAVTWIDWDHQIIPDVITLPGVVLGILAQGLLRGEWLWPLVGAAGGALGLWLVAFLYLNVAKREGLGFGDVKLAAMLGAFLGGPGVFLTVFAASMIGSAIGAVLIGLGRGSRTTMLPFGTFLAPVAVLVLFCGPAVIRWYWAQFGVA